MAVLGVAAAVLIWSCYSDLWMRAGAVWMVIAGFVYAWRWVLSLFVPMFALLIYGRILLAPDIAMYMLTHKVPLVVACLGLMVGITRFRAAKLRREIELLDLMAR